MSSGAFDLMMVGVFVTLALLQALSGHWTLAGADTMIAFLSFELWDLKKAQR